jgi:hypothetical protein
LRYRATILYADAVMHIERNHQVARTEAIRRIDCLLGDLARRKFPNSIVVSDASKSWSENVMHFSFKAKKAFFSATISGIVRVNDDSVTLDADLPGLVTTFVSEDEIQKIVNKQFDALFPA